MTPDDEPAPAGTPAPTAEPAEPLRWWHLPVGLGGGVVALAFAAAVAHRWYVLLFVW